MSTIMKTLKRPTWDKHEHSMLLFTPGTSGEKVGLNHLEVGMMIGATIRGVELKMRCTIVVAPSSAEAEIIRINNAEETIDGLSIGDQVVLDLNDMKWRDTGEDPNTP
jgi:hypothetical protein